MAIGVEVQPQVLQASAFAAHEEVMNKRDAYKFDRARMPWYGLLSKNKKERHFTRGKVIEKLQRDGGLELQLWQRKEVLDFDETFIDDEMVWDPFRGHIGLEVAHADLEDRGFVVTPNEKHNGKNIGSSIPSAAGDVLIDYFAAQIDDMMDAYDVRHDELLLRDGTQSSLAPAGLDAIMPLDNTTGEIAGKSRADALFRHIVIPGSTTGASGSLERDINRGVRLAEENTRGFPANIDFIMVGDDWLDAYVNYAKANGLRYMKDLDANPGVDIGIPDSRIIWNDIPVVRNPTFRRLDSQGFFTGTPWGKRGYFIASRCWELAYQKGKDKHFSAPMDSSDQRMSRLSLDSRYALICKKPNSQFLSTIA